MVTLRATFGDIEKSISVPKERIGASDDEAWVTLDDETKLPVQTLVTTDAVKAMSSSATDVPTWLVLTCGHRGEDGGLAEESLVSTAFTRRALKSTDGITKVGGKYSFADDQLNHIDIKADVMRLFAVADDNLDGDGEGGNNDGNNDGEAVQGGNNDGEAVQGGDGLIDSSLAPRKNRVKDVQVVVGTPSNDEAHEPPPANPEEKIRNLEEEIRNLKEARDVRTAYIEELESTIDGMIRAHSNYVKYVNNCCNSGFPIINDDVARQEFDDCIRQFNAGSEEARMAIAVLAAAAGAAAVSHCVRMETCNVLDLSLDGGSLVGDPGKKRTVSGWDASSADFSSDYDSQSVTSVVSDDGSLSGSSTGSNSPSNGRSTHQCTTCGTMSVIDDDPSFTGSTPFVGWSRYWCTTCCDWSFINDGPSTGRDLGEAEPSAKRQRIVGPSERDSSASDCLAISDFAFPAWQ